MKKKTNKEKFPTTIAQTKLAIKEVEREIKKLSSEYNMYKKRNAKNNMEQCSMFINILSEKLIAYDLHLYNLETKSY